MTSEAEKEKIRKEARAILDEFAKTLEKVPHAKHTLDEGDSYRKEREDKKQDGDFRKRIFENAPKKDKDFIIAEKASW